MAEEQKVFRVTFEWSLEADSAEDAAVEAWEDITSAECLPPIASVQEQLGDDKWSDPVDIDVAELLFSDDGE